MYAVQRLPLECSRNRRSVHSGAHLQPRVFAARKRFATNQWSLRARCLQVFRYFCTIILKLDDSFKGPYISESENSIGAVMVAVNMPMGLLHVLYFLYDITTDVRERAPGPHHAPR